MGQKIEQKMHPHFQWTAPLDRCFPYAGTHEKPIGPAGFAWRFDRPTVFAVDHGKDSFHRFAANSFGWSAPIPTGIFFPDQTDTVRARKQHLADWVDRFS